MQTTEHGVISITDLGETTLIEHDAQTKYDIVSSSIDQEETVKF